MIDRKIPVRDYCAGAFVVLVGAWALWEASHYAFGSLRSIGSGFFPSMLGLLAIPLGVAIVWEAATRPANAATDAAPDDRISESIEFRPIAAVVAALLAFTFLIDRGGLAPAIFVAVILASLAEPESRPLGSVLLAAGLVVGCAAIFVFGLNLPIRIVAW